MPFPPRVLANIRRTYNEKLPDTAIIRRESAGQDIAGMQAAPVAVDLDPVPARAYPARAPRQEMQADQQIATGDYKVTLPFGTDVKTNDIIIVSAGRERSKAYVQADASAKQYTVVKPPNADSEAFGLVVICEHKG